VRLLQNERSNSQVIILVWHKDALRAVPDRKNGLCGGVSNGQVFSDMSTQLPETARNNGMNSAAQAPPFLAQAFVERAVLYYRGLESRD
jgi:3-hydroxyisobutyrate dehydrogenase-like beta-hydroxyacid dehydrogenase